MVTMSLEDRVDGKRVFGGQHLFEEVGVETDQDVGAKMPEL